MKARVQEVESWISSNPDADATEYEGKQKELESVFNPLMSKIYQGGRNQGGMPNQQSGTDYTAGPQADEVD